MANRDDLDDYLGFADVVHDPEIAPARAEQRKQRIAQLPTDTVRVFGERSVDELEAGSRDDLRQVMRQ